ncbi:gamma-mobile-trio protein GmtX [Sphingosinicella humi]|nr:gamma-mobile-trio protein GmtX [Sphingosinicella humi]
MPPKPSVASFPPTDAEKCFARLLEGSKGSRRSNLETLWKALSQLRDEGVTDFSISAVGKRSQDLGGVQEQSIRNKNGAVYRELIDAFAGERGKTQSKSAAPQGNQIDRLIDEITDLGVRTLFKMEREEARRLKSENDMLRLAFRRLSIDTSEQGARDAGPASIALKEDQVSKTQIGSVSIVDRRAVDTFLSSDWLEARGWRIDPDGSIYDETTNWLVAPAGFADVLRRML